MPCVTIAAVTDRAEKSPIGNPDTNITTIPTIIPMIILTAIPTERATGTRTTTMIRER